MSSKNILEHFCDLHDPCEDNRRHKLIVINNTIVLSICGAENWNYIKLFGITTESWFRKYLKLPHGIPSHDTLGRVKVDEKSNEIRAMPELLDLPELHGGIVTIDAMVGTQRAIAEQIVANQADYLHAFKGQSRNLA